MNYHLIMEMLGTEATMEDARKADELVLCESADGWSLHALGASDDEIACGDAPYLVCGAGRPHERDYAEALLKLAA